MLDGHLHDYRGAALGENRVNISELAHRPLADLLNGLRQVTPQLLADYLEQRRLDGAGGQVALAVRGSDVTVPELVNEMLGRALGERAVDALGVLSDGLRDPRFCPRLQFISRAYADRGGDEADGLRAAAQQQVKSRMVGARLGELF